MRKTIVLFIVLLLLPASGAFSAPNVTGYSNGTVTGTGFGVNAAIGTGNIETLNANIEAGTPGAAFAKTDWLQDSTTETASQAVARYTTDESHSGNQSIIMDYAYDIPTYERYRGWFRYSHGKTMAKTYVSFWVKANSPNECENGGAGCQWKIWRLNHTGANDNNYPDFYQHHWTGESIGGTWPGGQTANMMYINTGGKEGLSAEDHWNEQDEIPGVNWDNEWTRMEFWFEESSVNTSDGTIEYWFHDPASETSIKKPIDRIGDQITREVDLHFEYAVFGHVSGIPNLLTYWEDIFIQVGTRARVEIGNASTWAACNHREIQIPTTWDGDGERVVTTPYQGSLPDGIAYVYVVDEDGNKNSSGYEITLGEEDLSPSVVMNNSGQTVDSTPLSSITGTATATTGRTITGVTSPELTVICDDGTWDEISETFTVSNVPLSEGLNTKTFTVTDNESDTGQASFTVTYTPSQSPTCTFGGPGSAGVDQNSLGSTVVAP